MKNLAMLPNYFDYITVYTLDKKYVIGPNQARSFCQLKLEPEPDPNSPARLTTLVLPSLVVKNCIDLEKPQNNDLDL